MWVNRVYIKIYLYIFAWQCFVLSLCVPITGGVDDADLFVVPKTSLMFLISENRVRRSISSVLKHGKF